MCFDKCTVLCIWHYNVMQGSWTAPNSSVLYLFIPFYPQTPDKHRLFLCHHSFDFFPEYGWNHNLYSLSRQILGLSMYLSFIYVIRGLTTHFILVFNSRLYVLFYPLTSWGTSLAVMNKTVVDTSVQVHVWMYIFNPLGQHLSVCM